MKMQFITIQDAVEKKKKKLYSVQSMTYSNCPKDPAKLDRHFQIVERAKDFAKELSQVIKILKLCDEDAKAFLATEPQYKRIVGDLADDESIEVAGTYCALVTIWQFPLGSPYILVHTKALNKAFK